MDNIQITGQYKNTKSGTDTGWSGEAMADSKSQFSEWGKPERARARQPKKAASDRGFIVADSNNTRQHGKSQGKDKRGTTLGGAVRQWPTPTARDCNGVRGRAAQARKGNPIDTLTDRRTELPDSNIERSQRGLQGRCFNKERREKQALRCATECCDWGSWYRRGAWPPEPGLGRVVDGCANRVDRIRMLGNGVVPQTAAKAWQVLDARFNDE